MSKIPVAFLFFFRVNLMWNSRTDWRMYRCIWNIESRSRDLFIMIVEIERVSQRRDASSSFSFNNAYSNAPSPTDYTGNSTRRLRETSLILLFIIPRPFCTVWISVLETLSRDITPRRVASKCHVCSSKSSFSETRVPTPTFKSWGSVDM